MSGTAAYNTKYWYSVILLIERKGASGAVHRSFKRENGTQLAVTPSVAATAIEKHYNKQDLIVDSITIRLRNDSGMILLQTQKDDMTDQLPVKYTPNADLAKGKTEVERSMYFDVYKFLTTRTPSYSVNPTFRVKDHMK